jgi:hypothetical protein
MNQQRNYEQRPGPRAVPDDAAEDFEQEIVTLERRDGALKVRAKTFKGGPFIDVRAFVRGTDGNLYPTAKGCSVRLSEVESVTEAIRRAAEVLEARRR